MHWFPNTLTLILFANSLITPHCEGQLNWVPGNATSPQKPGSSARAANRKYGQRGINEFRGCSVIHSTDLAAASIPKSTHRQVILSSSTNYQDGHSFYDVVYKYVCNQIPNRVGGEPNEKHIWSILKSSFLLEFLTYVFDVSPNILRRLLKLVPILMNTQGPQGGPPNIKPCGIIRDSFRMEVQNPSIRSNNGLQEKNKSLMICDGILAKQGWDSLGFIWLIPYQPQILIARQWNYGDVVYAKIIYQVWVN